jgi:hypothetical protein
MMITLPWRRRTADPGPSADTIVQAFESLGDNCEFGLVQRFCGAEPLGLFRFSGTTIADLVHALDTDFAHYGSEDDLAILASESGSLYCQSRRYGFAYTTSDLAASTEPGSILGREVRKVAYLKRRLLEDLQAGEKILVRKGPAQESIGDATALARAARRHGPSTLLWVRTADANHPPGSVAWCADGVMEGRVRRFAQPETAYDIDLESWLDLCRGALRLARGQPDPAPAPPPPNLLAKRSSRAGQHVLGQAADGLCVFGARQKTDRLAPRAIHVLSGWVWIPESFAGSRVGAAIGHYRHGFRDADLAVRDTWQRVWVAAQIPPHFRDIMMGLVANGPAGARLWSDGWRLEQGPVPSASPPPLKPPRS